MAENVSRSHNSGVDCDKWRGRASSSAPSGPLSLAVLRLTAPLANQRCYLLSDVQGSVNSDKSSSTELYKRGSDVVRCII